MPDMQGRPREETTIGVVGAYDLAHRVMAVARDVGSPSWRLIPAVYTAETDAHTQAMKLAGRVDVCLFAGPLPYDVAMEHGDLPVPATFVPTGGSALYAALLGGTLRQTFDPLSVTIDTITAEEVRAAYADMELDPSGVPVRPYAGPSSGEEFVRFHREHYKAGRSSGAITTVPTVASALAEDGIPSLKMTPTHSTIRQALHTAALIGSGARLEESRIVTIVVRVPASVVPAPATPSNYWYQELKLSLHRELLVQARPMDAVVLPRDEHSYLVVTTMGSLTTATDDLTSAPFLSGVRDALGIALEVGIGLGRTSREAEFNAQTAVDRAAASGGNTAFLVGPRETTMQLPADGALEPDSSGVAAGAANGGSGRDTESTFESGVHGGQGRAGARHGNPRTGSARGSAGRDSKALDTLRLLVGRLEEQQAPDRVVDAEKVASLLGVTLRTARRTLQTLVNEGLAWPMPPPRSSRIGRPPQPYQLLPEKLD